MNDMLNLMLFFGFFLGVTLAIGNLALKKERKRSDFYTVSIFMMGLWLLNIALYSTGMIKNYGHICTALLPFSYFAAASQYIRYDILVSLNPGRSRLQAMVYIPAAAVTVIVLVPAFSSTIEYNEEMLRFTPILSGEFTLMPAYFRSVLLLYPLLHLYHVVLFSAPLFRTSFIWSRRHSGQQLVLSKASYICALVICLSSAVAGIGSLFSLSVIRLGLFLGNNAMLLTFIFAMRYPEFRIKLHEEVKKYSYIKSKTTGLDVPGIIGRLEKAMTAERAYAVEGITIKTMATELGITVHQLSEILNRQMGKNFNSYINGYRISEAKRLLVEKPDMSIIEISGEIGFSSSSMFSTIFSKTEGISPRDFRKQRLNCE